jgi:predicted 3-demethylubiquinone-9 3-methyltransferase (glyoxalase superfamily)
MQKITPFLWFDDKAEEAMSFYVSIFKNSRIGSITRWGESGPGPKGTVMSATFQFDGQVRSIMADHSLGPRPDVGRPGCQKIKKGHGGDAEDGQD